MTYVNVLFLIFSFNTGGIEKQLVEMSNNMALKGHSVYLCIINHRYEDSLLESINKNVKLIKFERPENSKYKLKYMLRLSRIVKENNIQVIHCQEPTGVVFSFVAQKMNPGTKVVETVHDIGESKLYSKLILKIADMICDKYIAISGPVRKEIADRGIKDGRIVVINDAVNTKEYQMKRNNIENRVSIKNNERVEVLTDNRLHVGNVARFFPEKKGQDVLVRAIEILKTKYPDIQCCMAGGIYRGQEENWNRLEMYIKDHDLENNIRLYGNVENIPDFLTTIGIFVLPSIYEGFGISLIEAMAMGIPCIASNIDGPREIIKDSSLGVLAEPGNEQNLADKIDYVIENYESFNKEKISQYISDNYDIGAMVDKHLALYCKCIG